MSDHGRYGDTRYAERDRERDRRTMGSIFDADEGRGRERGSFFDGGRRERDRDRGELRLRDEDRYRDDDRPRRHEARHRENKEFDRDYGYDDHHEGLPIDETGRLIASNKVEGTAVYDREGDRLGTIFNFMVDKKSGQVEYAVMRHGGFLGMGQRYYPLPWRVLTYDTREGGYRIDMRHRDLERAPSFSREDEPRFNRDYDRRVHDWYGLDY